MVVYLWKGEIIGLIFYFIIIIILFIFLILIFFFLYRRKLTKIIPQLQYFKFLEGFFISFVRKQLQSFFFFFFKSILKRNIKNLFNLIIFFFRSKNFGIMIDGSNDGNSQNPLSIMLFGIK